MRQYVKIKKEAVSDIKLIEHAELKGAVKNQFKAFIFIPTDTELVSGKAVKFTLTPPGKDEEFIAYGVIDQYISENEENKGAAISIIEIERAQGGSDGKQNDTEIEDTEHVDFNDVASINISLPSINKIKEVLDSLLDMEITIEESEPISDESPRSITTFVTDSGIIGTVCICDLLLTCFIGGALDLIPVEEVQQYAESGEIPDNILNNFKEAMNVSASLFNSENSPRISTGDVLINPEKLNTDLNIVINKAKEISSYRITIPNYGEGTMTFYSAP